ncbi:hypothetical protein BDDG_07945 [Blastomyces dermatitidis ATCC 18188]|uniref:Uncharacterized protein n=1 Tax=Ajellomyces dermatitidis (strain ATCC 18188 / CBS 674.68) TaxID=653446 RepID=F2TP37_AJEDA|nr:hypothetical protein BDDG_07945 [Blastomyces dermatitidis ATCC 18188]
MEPYLLIGVFTLLTSIGFYLPVPFTNIHPDRPLSERLVGALQLTATGECAARLYNYLSTPHQNDTDSYALETDPKGRDTRTTIYTPIPESFQQSNAQRAFQDSQSPPQTVTVFLTSTITSPHGAGHTIMPDNIYEVPTNPEWVLSRWSLQLEDEILRNPNMYTAIILLFAFVTWFLSRSRHSRISASHDTTLQASKGTDTEFVQALTRLFQLMMSSQINTTNTTPNISETFNASLQHVQEQVNRLQTEQKSEITSARFASLTDLVGDLENKMARRPDLEELSAKVKASNSSLQSLKVQVDRLLEAPHSKLTGAELASLIDQMPDLSLKFTPKADFDQMLIRSTEMTDTLNSQNMKIQQAVGRWNEFTTWLQDLRREIQGLRTSLDTKGKEVKDLTMGFAQLKEKQKEYHQVTQRTLTEKTMVLELQKKITSSENKTNLLIQDVETLKRQAKNSEKTEISTVVLTDQIGELQAKMTSSEEAIQKLNREWELWMQGDDVSEGGGLIKFPNTQAIDLGAKVESYISTASSITRDLDTLKRETQESTGELQGKFTSHESTIKRLTGDLEALKNIKHSPNNQWELLQKEVASNENATKTLFGDLDKLKNAILESNSQTDEVRGKLRSSEDTLQRLANDVRALKNGRRDPNNEIKQLQEKVNLFDTSIERLTQTLETLKNGQQSGIEAKVNKLRSTLNEVDTIALTTRNDVDRITARIKEVDQSNRTSRALLTQQGIELLKLREKLGIIAPLTSPFDNESELAQKDAAMSTASMSSQISNRKELTKDIQNESAQTSTIPKDDKLQPSATLSTIQARGDFGHRHASYSTEETTSKEPARPTTSTILATLASPPLDTVASVPGLKTSVPKQQDKNISRWDPAYEKADVIPRAEKIPSQVALGAIPPLKGAESKELNEPLAKQTTLPSKHPSSEASSRQPDKNMSRWDPAYVGPEGTLSQDKKGGKKKSARK